MSKLREEWKDMWTDVTVVEFFTKDFKLPKVIWFLVFLGFVIHH